MNSYTTLISLVSQQTIPNILFIKEICSTRKIDQFIFITTEEMDKKGRTDHILNALKLFEINSSILRIAVDAENYNEITRVLKEKIPSLGHFIVNITGGTKMMSLAVHTVLKEKKSDIYYIPIQKKKSYQLINGKGNSDTRYPLEIELDLKTYLTACGVNIEKQEIQPVLSEKETVQLYHRFKRKEIREQALELWRINKDHRLKIHRKGISLKKLAEFNPEIASLYRKIGLALEDRITKEQYTMATGGWFEAYIYYLLLCQNDAIEKSRIGLNVCLKDAKKNDNEFDIMLIHHNRLWIIECKTGLKDENDNDILTGTLYKIDSLRKQFGLQVTACLITLEEDLLNDKEQLKDNKRKRADAMGIKLLTRADLEKGREHVYSRLGLK